MIDGNTQTKTTSIWLIDVHVETKPAAGPLSFCFVFVFVFVVLVITREISQASTSTTRGHFGCIFTAIADCAT
jgi:hypothetical protein